MTVLAALLLAAQTVAVLPLEAKALDPAQARALEAGLRAVAKDVLEPRGFALVTEPQGAAAVVSWRAVPVEGALLVGVALALPGSRTPVANARIVGVGVEAALTDARPKLLALFTKGLGPAPTEAPPTAPTPAPGARPPRPAPFAVPAPGVTPAAPEPPSQDPLVRLIREVTAEVESVRGLNRKFNLKVEILDDKLFSAALREKAQKEMTPGLILAERARWLAFGLAPASADPQRIYLDVLDEQVAGFYDPFTKALTVRKNPPEAAGAGALRDVLAHEIEHALQDQNFGFPDLNALGDDDQRLARVAIYEGDAMAVMAAVAARHAHRPVKASLEMTAAALRTIDTVQLLRMSGHSETLLKAPAVVREELTLPYLAGLSLVADVFRRGGWPLVDRLFAHPPASSHQVLHPAAYFAGEWPAKIATPPIPPGTRLVAAGRMGELGARLSLEQCVDRQVVKDFTERWVGDAYAIVEGPGKQLGLIWSTAWSGDAAAGVANLLKLEQPCWDEAGSGERGPAGWAMRGWSKTFTAAGRVVLARGLEETEASAKAAIGTRLELPRALRPLGEAALPPAAARGRVEGGQFTSVRLGLSGPLPEGYEADVASPASELILRRTGGFASLTFVPEPLTPDAAETFFQAAAAQIAAGPLAGKSLSLAGRSHPQLFSEAVEERSWNVEAGGKLRIDLAPLCGGKAYLAVVRVHLGDTARDALDHFATSLQRAPRSPACSDLE